MWWSVNLTHLFTYNTHKQNLIDFFSLSLITLNSLIQSMTLGFWTYKPFGPVLMRILLARIHIHWPESKLTKSDINWKKVMKSIMISRLFSWIKKIWVSLFGAPPVHSPHPHHSTLLHLHSASCHILVHVRSLRSSLGRIWVTCSAPTLFRIKIIWQKSSQFCLTKWHV